MVHAIIHSNEMISENVDNVFMEESGNGFIIYGSRSPMDMMIVIDDCALLAAVTDGMTLRYYALGNNPAYADFVVSHQEGSKVVFTMTEKYSCGECRQVEDVTYYIEPRNLRYDENTTEYRYKVQVTLDADENAWAFPELPCEKGIGTYPYVRGAVSNACKAIAMDTD